VKQNLLGMCTQWGERLTTLLAIKSISQAPHEDGIAGGKGSLLCDHGSDALARCPRGKAPPNSLDKCHKNYEHIKTEGRSLARSEKYTGPAPDEREPVH